jgi:hypothetical protein
VATTSNRTREIAAWRELPFGGSERGERTVLPDFDAGRLVSRLTKRELQSDDKATARSPALLPSLTRYCRLPARRPQACPTMLPVA